MTPRYIADLVSHDADAKHSFVMLIKALGRGDNLIVSASSAGPRKRFIAEFMRHLDPALRVVAAGEASDIQVPHANLNRLEAAAGDEGARFDHNGAIALAANNAADLLLAGELMEANTPPLLEVVRSEKTHLVGTITATGSDDAHRSLHLWVSKHLGPDDVERLHLQAELRARIRIVHVEQSGDRLRITQIN